MFWNMHDENIKPEGLALKRLHYKVYSFFKLELNILRLMYRSYCYDHKILCTF